MISWNGRQPDAKIFTPTSQFFQEFFFVQIESAELVGNAFSSGRGMI